jgi:hypothetical protein
MRKPALGAGNQNGITFGRFSPAKDKIPVLESAFNVYGCKGIFRMGFCPDNKNAWQKQKNKKPEEKVHSDFFVSKFMAINFKRQLKIVAFYKTGQKE